MTKKLASLLELFCFIGYIINTLPQIKLERSLYYEMNLLVIKMLGYTITKFPLFCPMYGHFGVHFVIPI